MAEQNSGKGKMPTRKWVLLWFILFSPVLLLGLYLTELHLVGRNPPSREKVAKFWNDLLGSPKTE